MPDLSPEAKAYLDHLWPLEKLTLADIRRKMEQRFAVKFNVDELRAAARKPASPQAAPVVIPIAALAPKPVLHKPVIVREKQCVNPVAKGTHKVPEGGFTMLRSGRLYERP